jgi:AcrR family transcriptional regulator
MSKEIPYHHGDLRAALVKAAAAEIERGGYETLSLRELAASLDVSRAAPYRHFADRQALLATLAAEGFVELATIYRKVIAARKSPHETLATAGRAYLAFAAEHPQLFRLMFASDLLGGSPPDPALIKAASDCYDVFEGMVAETLKDPDDSTVKAATIAIMSSTYGFALLRMGGRLKPFMVGGLTQNELIDTVLSMKATKLPRATRQKRRKKS